jgi:hypothetical protein
MNVKAPPVITTLDFLAFNTPAGERNATVGTDVLHRECPAVRVPAKHQWDSQQDGLHKLLPTQAAAQHCRIPKIEQQLALRRSGFAGQLRLLYLNSRFHAYAERTTAGFDAETD